MENDVNTRSVGTEFEDIALKFLEGLGYTLIKRNFTFGKVGEIDLVMMDADVTVFVEVKGRRTHTYGLPEESVTHHKKQTLKRVARGYFYVNRTRWPVGRFDVVAVDFVTGTGKQPEIRHYKNAFL